MDNPLGVALDSSLNIYVANAGTLDGGFDSVTVYPAGSYADVAPSAVIGSFGAPDNTGLNYPSAILVGPGGGIYVANSFGGSSGIGSVTRYAAGSNGNVAPTATLSGSSTGLYEPVSLAMGSEDYLHVLNAFGGPDGAGSVTIYNVNTGYTINGNVAPSSTISGNSNGDQTGFNSPSGIALDSSHNIYVTNQGSLNGGIDSVTVYANGSSGNVAPMATISGSSTQLNVPNGIAIDSIGNIWVANDGSIVGGVDSITVYPPGSNGNVAPAMQLSNGNIEDNAIISGVLTGLSQPAGIAITLFHEFAVAVGPALGRRHRIIAR